jgi:hypothetical protein
MGLDVALLVGLLVLTRRFRPRLAGALNVLVAGDALMTAVQAVAYNLPRARGAVDLVVLTLAVLAPASATLLLWRARRRLR